MSTSYDASFGVGFLVDEQEVIDAFSRTRLERSHFEECFDTKTGRQLDSVKVVDKEAGVELVIGDDVFDLENDRREFWEALGGLLNCNVDIQAVDCTSGEDASTLAFTVNYPKGFFNEDDTCAGRLELGGSADFYKVCELDSTLEVLAKRLVTYKIPHGPAKVFLTGMVG